MSQVFQVLRCYQCETFQVQQKKKRNKWLCKLCNSKQSVVKVYFEGGAPDCRKHVQKLNMMRGDEQITLPSLLMRPTDAYSDCSESSEESPETNQSSIASCGQSKWSAFIQPQDSEEDIDNDDIYRTSSTEFEQVFRRIRGQKGNAKNSRVTGFHPVSKKPFQKPSTVTHKYSDQSSLRSTEEIFPYSFVTENIDSLLRENTMKITGSKSHNNLDDVHGTYRKMNTDSELPSSISLSDQRTSKIPSSSEKPCITKDYESLRINACTGDSSCSKVSKQSSDSTGQSKWSQFLSTEPD